MAALNHPHVCALFDVGHDYLVMEYVEGKPLHGPLPVEQALHVGGAAEPPDRGARELAARKEIGRRADPERPGGA